MGRRPSRTTTTTTTTTTLLLVSRFPNAIDADPGPKAEAAFLLYRTGPSGPNTATAKNTHAERTAKNAVVAFCAARALLSPPSAGSLFFRVTRLRNDDGSRVHQIPRRTSLRRRRRRRRNVQSAENDDDDDDDRDGKKTADGKKRRRTLCGLVCCCCTF